MIRIPITVFLFLLCAALGAQAPTPKESAAEEMLRLFLRKETPEPDHFLGSRIEETRKAVIRHGPAAIPGLLAALKNDKASKAERTCAVQALIELDPQGKHARELLTLLEQGRIPFTIGNSSGSQASPYLGRFLQDEADLRRVVGLLAQEDRETVFVALNAFARFHPDQEKRFAPEVLRKMKNMSALSSALLLLKVDGEEVRAACQALARDETKPRHIRLAAVEAWAERVGKDEYQRVAEALRRICLGNTFPEEALTILGRLDWKATQPEFNRHFAALRQSAVQTARDKDNPPPFPRNSYRDLARLGTEDQLHAVLKDLLEHARKGGSNWENGPGAYHLWELGYREAAPLALERKFLLHHDRAALHHRFGLDVRKFVANTLEKESPWSSFRLAANENLPAALILKHKQDFIERCEKVLTSRASYEDFFSRSPQWHAVEESDRRREAFVILSRLAPERAKLHAAAFKEDPLPKAAPEIDWLELRELVGEYQQQKDWRARLETARRLLSRSHLLPEKLIREVERELVGYMRALAGSERHSLAALLAMHGNQEGEAALDFYLQGKGQSRSSHSVFNELAWWAGKRPEPFAGRARRLLLAAVSHHIDPNVRAAAVQAAARCLHVREEKGRPYPFIRALLDQLGPEQDWRVRAAAGLVLRRAFKDLWPEWDYYHLGDQEEMRRAANDIRKWWGANEAKVVWVHPAESVVGFGYFQVGK